MVASVGFLPSSLMHWNAWSPVGATLWADSGSSGFAGGSTSLKVRCASLNTSVFLVHSLHPAYGSHTPSAFVSSPGTYCLLLSFPAVTDSYLNLELQARIGSFYELSRSWCFNHSKRRETNTAVHFFQNASFLHGHSTGIHCFIWL